MLWETELTAAEPGRDGPEATPALRAGRIKPQRSGPCNPAHALRFVITKHREYRLYARHGERSKTMRTPWTSCLAEFLSALAAIVVIDLVLAGDNAIVIALAARNVPRAPAEARDRLGHGRRDRRAHGA